MIDREYIHIALLEDEELIRSMIQINLEHHGYKVTAFEKGEDLLSHGYATRFDLYILDLMLPGISGGTVTEKLRDLGVHNPIFMVTAKSDLESCVSNLSKGVDDYLVKPFEMDELLVRLKVLLRRAKLWQCPALANNKRTIV